MTDIQQQLFNELFTRYGSPCKDSADKTIYLHFYHPEQLDKITDVARYDKRAEQDIKDLENYIEKIKVYRLALAERYNYITTAPITPVIELKRYKSYSTKKVTYSVNIYNRDLNTGKDILVSSNCYPGTDRKKAIEQFDNYISTHPGIITIKDIDKSPWER